MEVRNCKGCGRLFNYMGGKPLCPNCIAVLEDKFKEVKEYLRENVYCTMQELADQNDVTIQQIKQWVREERLTFTSDSPLTIECENCGAPIKTGKYCINCVAKLQNSLQSVIKKPEQVVKKQVRDGDRMRFLDQN